jgi:hypothetical protein
MMTLVLILSITAIFWSGVVMAFQLLKVKSVFNYVTNLLVKTLVVSPKVKVPNTYLNLVLQTTTLENLPDQRPHSQA